MHDHLIQRYLGNKSPIASEIVEVVRRLAKPGDLVFDPFAGSLAVSATLREAGFRLACNDINHFSWLYAKAYLSGNGQPWPNGRTLRSATDKLSAWNDAFERLTMPYRARSDVPLEQRRSDFFDHYCEMGTKSAFTSGRGKTGRRRFFSPENATLIDRALSRIRYRYRTGSLDDRTRCILTAALLTAVEKVSNTQGTYHDFPRDFVDRRALRPLRISPAPPTAFRGLASKYIGKAEDSLEFCLKVPAHKVMYIDPPYNFRQYTSYYFMLNLISSYAEIEDIDAFFSKLEFVRGQNMSTDFKSTFCSRATFISSLETLIKRSRSDYVVLSYFDGRNHWGQFKSADAERFGRKYIEQFMRGDLFRPGSLECIPVARQNYQSYGGFTAKQVQEFLFVARRSRLHEINVDLGRVGWTGRALA